MNHQQAGASGETLISVSELQKIGQDVHQMGLTDFTYWFEFRERLAPLLQRKFEEVTFYEANWWRLDNLKRGLDAENQRARIADLEQKVKEAG